MTSVRRVTVSAAVMVAALAVPSTAFAAAPAHNKGVSAKHDDGCKTGVLPESIKGKPVAKPGDPLGTYVGHDSHGYTLFVTHPLVLGTDGKPVKKGQTKVVFTGRIDSNRAMHYSPRKLEKGDRIFISNDRKTILFRFNNYGYLDGLRFTANCSAKVSFNLKTNGVANPVTTIFQGTNKVNPATNPFTIMRTKPVKPIPAPTATPSTT